MRYRAEAVLGYFELPADLKLAIDSSVAEMSAPTKKRKPAVTKYVPFNEWPVNRNTMMFTMNGMHRVAKKAPTRPNLDSLMTDVRIGPVKLRTFGSYGKRN
jgi:hypothetical protein